MKQHHTLALTFLAALAFTAGCKPAETKTTGVTPDTMEKQADKIARDTKEVAQEVKDYAFAQKTEFVEAMQIQLTSINQDLDQLSEKVEKSTGAAKAEAQAKLKLLREQATKLNTQLAEAKDATESTWGDIKGGFKKGYGELKEGFQQARQWVSDKIAP